MAKFAPAIVALLASAAHDASATGSSFSWWMDPCAELLVSSAAPPAYCNASLPYAERAADVRQKTVSFG